MKPIVVLLGTLAVLTWLVFSLISGTFFFRIPRAESELYGTYIADYRLAAERLVLKDDETFDQEVTLKLTSEVARAEGSWSYDPIAGEVTFHNLIVTLNMFRQPNPDFGHTQARVVEPAEVWFGRTRLGVEEHILYNRISSDTRRQ